MLNKNRTFVMIKPDGFRRGLVGEIISRFEKKKLTIEMMRMCNIERNVAEAIYEEHRGQYFFNNLIDFTISGPVVLLILSGPPEIVDMVRKMIGATNYADALPGTIRGDFTSGPKTNENVIHSSNSNESFEREFLIVNYLL